MELLAGPPDGFRSNIGSPYLNQLLVEKSASGALIVGDENIYDHHPELARSILRRPKAEQGDMLARIAVAMHKSGVHCAIVHHNFEQYHVDAERLHCMAKEIAQENVAVMSSSDAALVLEFMCDPNGNIERDRTHDGDRASVGIHPQWEAKSLRFWPVAVLNAVLNNDEAQYDPAFLSVLEGLIRKWRSLESKEGHLVYEMLPLIVRLNPDLQEPVQTYKKHLQDKRAEKENAAQDLHEERMKDPVYAEWKRTPSQQEIDEALAKARHPGLVLVKTDRPDEVGCPGSWLGGAANLPPEIDWPCFDYEVEEEIEDEDGEVYADFVTKKIPKHLLAQIDLATLPRIDGSIDLPEWGTLFFFFEPFADNEIAFNRKSLAMNCVIYSSADVSEFALRQRPNVPYPETLEEGSPFFGHPLEGYTRRPFEYLSFDGYRSTTKSKNGTIETAIVKAYLDSMEHVRAQLSHRQFTRTQTGTSQEINEAQVYFARNPANAYYYKTHHMFGGQTQIEPEGNLIRLLAIQTDPDLGFEFYGDWVVFWIEKDDLTNRRFEKAFITAERA
ncbi:DUF1963 domain-containing protein [Yoonia maritima]|uniref:DUF1963 domain-containing protein n=1 Tax=Yoonia maritima TaxID=1435347 RepID=UPI0013A64D7E|nr:DUF1963 domain-containing protein [Yoonia maritima]